MKILFQRNFHHFEKKLVGPNSGSTVIFVVVISVIASIVLSSIFLSTRQTHKSSGNQRVKVNAFNIAEAGKDRVLADLRSRAFNPIENKDSLLYLDEPFASGAYTVRCSTNIHEDTVFIVSKGTTGAATITINVIASIDEPWMKWIKGAITARIEVQTLGNIIADGRDYDTIGADTGGTLLSPVRGTFGIASCDTISVEATSQVGGHTTAPIIGTKIPGETVLENMDTTGYPTTPEEVLGVPAGSLDKYKIHNKKQCPEESFFGIVYIENPSNATDICNFKGGILIVHNTTGDASLFNFQNDFQGLVIADENTHINGGGTVLGGLIFLGKNAGGNCIGNGGAIVHYSSRMLEKAVMSTIAPERRPVTVISWSQS